MRSMRHFGSVCPQRRCSTRASPRRGSSASPRRCRRIFDTTDKRDSSWLSSPSSWCSASRSCGRFFSSIVTRPLDRPRSIGEELPPRMDWTAWPSWAGVISPRWAGKDTVSPARSLVKSLLIPRIGNVVGTHLVQSDEFLCNRGVGSVCMSIDVFVDH